MAVSVTGDAALPCGQFGAPPRASAGFIAYLRDMTIDSSDPAKPAGPGQPPGSGPDLPRHGGLETGQDVDPATIEPDEDDEARLPDLPDEPTDAIAEGPLAVGRAAIEHAVRHAPTSPGVYRMMNAARDVLYVGKAKNVRKRLSSYARPTGQVMRIARMIAATC